MSGFLEVGVSADGREVVINHPDLQPDARGVGHIVFSPDEARDLARVLLRKADECPAPTVRARPYAVGPTNRNPFAPGTSQSTAYETGYRHRGEDDAQPAGPERS
jgi:hypothetical protein